MVVSTVEGLRKTGQSHIASAEGDGRNGERPGLLASHPLRHALLWIGLYVVVVNVGDQLSARVGVPNSVTALLLVGLSAWLVLSLRRGGWLRYHGVRPLSIDDVDGTLLYLPLVAIVGLQLTRGLRGDLDLTTVLLVVVLMACVGLLEELIFRGLLLRAIQRSSTLTRAVVISGVTFGVGHVVNLARGMAPTDQAIQVGFGVVIGIVLALLFVVTGTIMPLVVFHALLNISGNLVVADAGQESLMLAGTTVLCAGYAAYLVHVLRRRGPSAVITQPPPVR